MEVTISDCSFEPHALTIKTPPLKLRTETASGWQVKGRIDEDATQENHGRHSFQDDEALQASLVGG